MSTAAGSNITRRAVCRTAALALATPLLGACSGAPGAQGEPSPTASPSPTGRHSASPSAAMWRGAQVVRHGEVVVRGTVTTTRLHTVATMAGEAIERVRKVWGHGALRGPLTIDVPRNEAQFRGRGGNTEPGAQIAATTTTDGKVVLAPSLFDNVTAPGRVVVLTHELTHVALHQADLTSVRRWVIEGSAEFTAYHGSSLTLAQLAPTIAAAVRSGKSPAEPPADGMFQRRPSAAYQSAYTWCLFLASRFGQQRFVRFVRAADAGGTKAFLQTFGVREASLRTPYRTFLQRRIAASSASRTTG